MTKINARERTHTYKFTHVFGYYQASVRKCYTLMLQGTFLSANYLLNKNHMWQKGAERHIILEASA